MPANKVFSNIPRQQAWVMSQVDRASLVKLILALMAIFTASYISAVMPQKIGEMVDKLLIDFTSFSDIVSPLMFLAFLYIAREVVTMIRKFYVELASTTLMQDLTIATCASVIKMDIHILNGERKGGLNGRIQRSIDGAVQMLKLSLMDFIPAFSMMLFAAYIGISKNVALGSIMCFVLPTSFALISWQIQSQNGIRIELLRTKENNDSNFVEMLDGIESIRVAAEEVNITDRIGHVVRQLKNKEMKHHIAMIGFDAAKALNHGLAHIIVLSLSFYYAFLGLISPGDILVYSLLFISIIKPLEDLHRVIDHSHEAALRTSDLRALLSAPADQSYVSGDIAIDLEPAYNSIAVELTNISFAYNQIPLLDNLNLAIAKGAFIGFVGESGCGKSTVIKSILNINHIQDGKISIFGQDLSQLSRKSLAKHIAYVPQTPFIFSGTIKENILFGCAIEKNMADIENAARKAAIYDDIVGMGGFDAYVTEGGKNLSGGQKQRIALCRVFLANPALIVLDEATSALDNITESVIIDNLLDLIRESSGTLICIAHRLSTLKDANKLYVFDHGSIIQEGSFKELSVEDGAFNKLLASASIDG